MLKARGQTGDGTPLVVIGLSGENMTRLMAKEPIQFDLAELGLPPTQDYYRIRREGEAR